MEFVHLHVNTEYSLLYGECRTNELCAKVASFSQKAVAITDISNLFGAVEFYKQCKKNKIKAIIGCELAVGSRSRFERDTSVSNIVLLAKNENGYKNLVKLVSAAYLEGEDVRVDRELISKYSSDLIMLTGGSNSPIIKHLLSFDVESAREELVFYKSVFGRNVFVELNRQDESLRRAVEGSLLLLAKDLSLPIVAANEVRYVEKTSAELRRAITMIGDGTTYNDEVNRAPLNDNYYLKSSFEMETLFQDLPEAIENTSLIADMCSFDFDFGSFHLPKFPVPDGENRAYLRTKTYEGLKSRKNSDPSISLRIYGDRINYELSIIEEMGFVDYYLIVDDFVRYAKKRNIPVGPGRGSGVGSLVAYCLGITDVDPIKYKLLFERFLNPERVSMPDFDIDFCYDRRGEVIDYVKEKYSSEHVAQIITFGTMSCRAAVRDVGRILGMSHFEIDSVAKLLPRDLGVTVDSALASVPKLKELYETSNEVRRMLDISRSLDGRPRHSSTHATAVVITDKPIIEYMPLSLNGDIVVTQFAMNEVAELGLLKIDFLGLRNLTILKNTETLVKEKEVDFSLEKIDFNDEKTYSLISAGKTAGVFQLESSGMKSLLSKMKPNRFEDLIVAISLYRPGPMQSISTYLRNRENPDLINYEIDSLKEFLGETYGIMIYQEQVMEICRNLAGFSYGHADIVRRAMAKKKQSEMEKERVSFIKGALNNGIKKEHSEKVFDTMSEFAKYAFNKSHAAAYAVTSFKTAYMKTHYPKEFICALMSSVMNSAEKTREYAEDARSLGIPILPPDINKSEMYHSVEGDAIRFGLLGVKNVGVNLVLSIIRERQNGLFVSIEDFLERVHTLVNIRMIESLVQCGAFDCFGIYRSRLFGAIPSAYEQLERSKRKEFDGQIGLFDTNSSIETGIQMKYKDIDEYPTEQKLTLERELTGIYLSGHPLSDYDGAYKKGISKLISLKEQNNLKDKIISVLGMITDIKVLKTKKGEEMAFASLEDVESECELVVFPKIYSKTKQLYEVGNILVIEGKCELEEKDQSNDPYLKIIVSNASIAQKSLPDIYDIYIKLDGSIHWEKAAAIAKKAPDGSSNLVLYFEKEKRLLRLKEPLFEADEPTLKHLKSLFGEANVVPKKR